MFDRLIVMQDPSLPHGPLLQAAYLSRRLVAIILTRLFSIGTEWFYLELIGLPKPSRIGYSETAGRWDTTTSIRKRRPIWEAEYWTPSSCSRIGVALSNHLKRVSVLMMPWVEVMWWAVANMEVTMVGVTVSERGRIKFNHNRLKWAPSRFLFQLLHRHL